jgi:hypothetical protein
MRGNTLTRLQLALIWSAVFEEWPIVRGPVDTKGTRGIRSTPLPENAAQRPVSTH